MTVSLSPLARMQFNQSGIPLAGGLLFTYAAGTNTKLATYTDATGLTPNTNPIVLDANGQCDLWLTDGQAYKLALSPSTDTDPPTNTYWIRDNVSNNVIPFNPTFNNVTVAGTLSVTGNSTFAGTINKVTITPPATAATMTLANNSTLATVGAFSTTLTATGTTTLTLPTNGTLALNTQPTDTFGALTDVTTNNASVSAHGFLPKLSGNTLQFLNGVGAWASAPAQTVIRSTRTSNTILAGADNASFVDITSGTFSQTFTAAATLGNGWYVWLRNSGTGDITLDPNGAELIDGLTSYIMYPGEVRLVSCDGVGFTSIVCHPFFRTATSTFTFITPPGYLGFGGLLWGAGGAGAKGTNAISSSASGGGGGACVPFLVSAASLGASVLITIGAGGAGPTTAATNGGVGGTSSIGSVVFAYGGGGGVGSGSGVTTSGAGGGALSAGATGGGANGSAGGGPAPPYSGQPTTGGSGFGGASGGLAGFADSAYGGAAGGTAATAAAGNSLYGGAGGGAISTIANAGGTSVYGGNGGASVLASSGVNGSAPAGGGGATQTGTKAGDGARGECRIWGVA